MRALTTAEIAAMRATQTAALPGSGALTRATLASDSAGGQTRTWASVDASVECRLGKPDRRALEIANRLGVEVQVVITVPAATDARVGDRLTVDGVVYTLTHVAQPESVETARVCMAKA